MDKAHLTPASTVRDLARQSSPPLMLRTAPPEDPMEVYNVGLQIWAGVLIGFERQLSSDRDRILWREIPPLADVQNSAQHLEILHRFDAFLLAKFEELGWRLFMSSHVLQRIAQWEMHSPALLKRLGEALALRSEVFRGAKSAPLTEGIEIFADGAIEELKVLLRRQRDEFGSRRGAPSCSRIAGWIKTEIEHQPKDYPRLRSALPQLCGWVETLPHRNTDMAAALLRGQLTASAFFYTWYAVCANRSVKDVQNIISMRRTASRKNRK